MLYNVSHHEVQWSETICGLCPSWNCTDVPGTGPLAYRGEILRKSRTKFTNGSIEPFCGHPWPVIRHCRRNTPHQGKQCLSRRVSIRWIAIPVVVSYLRRTLSRLNQIRRQHLPSTQTLPFVYGPTPGFSSLVKFLREWTLASSPRQELTHRTLTLLKSGGRFIEWLTGWVWRSDHGGLLLTGQLCHPGQTI